jgi:RsiW-degrading membrane proteinase PrsW (M82 family)
MKFIVKLFRNSPASTGLLSLFILLHLVGDKDFGAPMIATEGDVFAFLVYCCVMASLVLFILPRIKPQNKEKVTWTVVAVTVVVLTVIAKIIAL